LAESPAVKGRLMLMMLMRDRMFNASNPNVLPLDSYIHLLLPPLNKYLELITLHKQHLSYPDISILQYRKFVSSGGHTTALLNFPVEAALSV
jgi:hypothetical protein